MGEVDVYALRGIDFSLYNRELAVILGQSGSGKTTLVNLLGGIDRATAGELYFGDLPIHRLNENELTEYRRIQVGFIFQFYNLMPNLTATENIKLGAQIAHEPLEAADLLEKLGLADRAEHFPAQLSGGEQQRIAIARALAKNPRLLLCDEPTGALDLPTGRQILALLRRFCDEYGKTVVLITHNANISEMADRVIYLKDGKVEWSKRNDTPISPEEVDW